MISRLIEFALLVLQLLVFKFVELAIQKIASVFRKHLKEVLTFTTSERNCLSF